MTRRAFLGSASVCLLAGVGGVFALAPSDAAVRARLDPDAISALGGVTDAIALTFDDGPDPRFTPHVLDALRAVDARATFFVIGRNAERYPDLVRQIADEGHELANHTWDHLWLDQLDEASVRAQLDPTQRLLDSVSRTSGQPGTQLVRPPRGRINETAVRQVHAAGLRNVFWGMCLEAESHDGPRAGAQRVAARISPGGVLLCHDGGSLDGPNPQQIDRTNTVAALPELLDGLKARGLAATSVGALLARTGVVSVAQ